MSSRLDTEDRPFIRWRDKFARSIQALLQVLAVDPDDRLDATTERLRSIRANCAAEIWICGDLAAQSRQVNGRWPHCDATQADKTRSGIFEMIIGALHDSRRRQSERLLLHDYRHLTNQEPNQLPANSQRRSR